MKRERIAMCAGLGVMGLVAACTAGTGSASSTAPLPREVPPNERDSPGASRANPGVTRDDPGNARQGANDREPPSSAPGASSGGTRGLGACPACDTSYDCVVILADGGTRTSSVDLATTNGACEVVGSDVVFNCDGTYTPTKNGTSGGTWVSAPGGGFSVTQDGTTVTCLPSSGSTPTPVNPPPSG